MTITASWSCRHGQDGLLRYWQACLVDRSKDEWDCQQYRLCELLVSRLAAAPGMALQAKTNVCFVTGRSLIFLSSSLSSVQLFRKPSLSRPKLPRAPRTV